MKKLIFITIVILPFFFWNCESESPVKNNRVVIGVSADVENVNPLYAFGLLEGNIRELLFLSLVKHQWDENIGELNSAPLLAEKWEWNNDSTSLIFYLRDDIYWSDSVKLSAEDIVYTFDLYSDAKVNSSFYGGFEKFYTDTEQQIDLEKTFNILSPNKIKFNFKPGSKPNLFDVDMPIVPKHAFLKISREEMSTTNIEANLITNGPYTLSNWKKNEAIILKAVQNAFLYTDDMVKEIIFKIIPDENSRINQLKKGEIDLIEDVNTEAIPELKKHDHIKIITRTGRDYDYIGWNNIDPNLYSKSKKIVPNKFFGSANIRRALSYAINREEILKEYLQGFGELSFSPVSPIFKSFYDSNIKPYEYNPAKAKEILTTEGWIDANKNGTIIKNNVEFDFKMYIAAGNPRRSFAATVVKNNLKAVGIDVTIETMEMSSFINKMFMHEMDAYMAGWTVPVPIDLQPYWHSKFERSPFNISGFSNMQVDEILDALEVASDHDEKAKLYKKIQELLHENEPTTFLYWIDIKTAYNSKIENINISPLGAIQHCWEWRIR